MAGRRTYADLCGVARALDVLGERWALLVVRDLLLGPKRFTDLRTSLPGVSPDVLSQRLRELEAAGVVRRATLPPPAAARVYELTERGHELRPLVLELGRWGSRAAIPADVDLLGVDSFVLALLTLFDPSQAGDLDASYQLHVDDQRFVARVVGGRLSVERGTSAGPALVLSGSPTTMAAVLWNGRSVSGTERSGALTLSGDRGAFDTFRRLFPAPAEHASS